jgi:hypothetical protein
MQRGIRPAGAYQKLMLMKTVAAICHRKEHAPVKVAFAYEDDPAFRAAMETYRGVAGQLIAQFEFRDFWWRFDALAKPALFERAVGIAAEADLVFCCPGNPHVLPRLVLDWLRHWLTRRTQPDGALVILLPFVAGTTPSQTLVERDLRETARVSGLACFVNYYLSGHAPHQPTRTFGLSKYVGEDLDAVRVVQQGAGVNHWGLNE